MRVREQHPSLWARVEDGEITRPVGPRPYRADGDIVQGWTDAEIEAIGFQRVMVDYNDQFDPDVQSMLVPEDFVEAGQVVRRITYEFQPSARYTMLKKVNKHYDHLAYEQFDLTPLVYIEHLLVEEDAKKAAVDADPIEENYPLLAKGIGINRKPDGNIVSTLQEQIELVQAKADALRSTLEDWRLERLTVRADIAEAATDDAAFLSYRSVIPAPPHNPPWPV